MTPGTNQVEEYYVVFDTAHFDYWFSKRMKKGFTHCYAIKKSKGGYFWHIINPTRGSLELNLVPIEDYPTIRDCVGYGPTIVSVKAIIDTQRFRGTICLFNCVEVVKALLGIKDMWLWTPYQLYKYLRRIPNG